jgi:hypothetical protein
MLQTILALAVVAAAALWLARGWIWPAKTHGGCGCSKGGCADKASPPEPRRL